MNLVSFFVLIASVSCKSAEPAAEVAESQALDAKSTGPEKSQSTAVLVFGDQGTGDEGQKTVAKAMTKICLQGLCGQDALVLGDNFYPTGVKDQNDTQFREKFELPYQALRVWGMKFHVVLGNHDYGFTYLKNPLRQNGSFQAQIDYTSKGTGWHMPARYYKFSTGAVDYFALDTNGPNDCTVFDDAQEQWLRLGLQESKSLWKVVFAHHPVFSAGEHGDTALLVKKLLPILCEHADLYLSGHDHDLQVLGARGATDCPARKKTPLIFGVSGGGGKVPRVVTKKHPNGIFYYAGLGFHRVEFGERSFKVTVHRGEDGEILFEQDFAGGLKPRATL